MKSNSDTSRDFAAKLQQASPHVIKKIRSASFVDDLVKSNPWLPAHLEKSKPHKEEAPRK